MDKICFSDRTRIFFHNPYWSEYPDHLSLHLCQKIDETDAIIPAKILTGKMLQTGPKGLLFAEMSRESMYMPFIS